MRILKVGLILGIVGVIGLALACGSSDEDVAAPASGGADPRAQFDGRAALKTPTPAVAQKEATQSSIIQYAGGYGGTSQTESLTAAQAAENVGKSGTVCGLVASTEYEPEHPYRITILNLDKAEDPDFFVYFWHTPLRIGHWPDKADRSIDLSNWFNGKNVCVEGRIEHYRDTPAINANYWHQYEVTEQE